MSLINTMLYLGVVCWRSPEGFPRGPFVQLQPLYLSEENSDHWDQIKDTREEFPNRGYATWFSPSNEVLEGSLWFFKVEYQPSFEKDNPSHDMFKVTDTPTSVTEVIDLAGDDPEIIREQLTGQGLYLPFNPTFQVYLNFGNSFWIGPLRLEKKGINNSWLVSQSESSSNHVYKVHALPEDLRITLRIDGKHREFLLPKAKNTIPIGKLDWDPDPKILGRVLKWIRRIDKEYTDQLNIVEKAINHAVDILYPSDDDSPAETRLTRELENYRLERARKIIPYLEQRKKLLEELKGYIITLPEIEEEINSYRKRAQENINRDINDERSQQMENLHKQLEKLRLEKQTELDKINVSIREKHLQEKELVEKINSLKTEFENELAKTRLALANQVNDLDQTLKERINEIKSRPIDLLSELVIFRALLDVESNSGSSEPESKVGRAVTPSTNDNTFHKTIVPKLFSSNDSFEQVNEQNIMRQLLHSACKKHGVPTHVIGSLHSAFLAGSMPILAGDIALSALEAYAAILANGRLLWIPISSLFVDPVDLFGKYDPLTKQFIPHASGLLDLLHEAQSTNDLYIVVLDGINRAPIEFYLEPVLASYSGIAKGKSKPRLPLVHPSLLSENDLYRDFSRIEWPGNVLLAGIVHDGMAVPIPKSIWSSAAFINFDLFRGHINKHHTQPPVTELGGNVSASAWEHWRDDASKVDTSEYEEFLEAILVEEQQLPRTLQLFSTRFYQCAYEWFANNTGKALSETITSCIIPQAIMWREKLLKEVVGSAGIKAFEAGLTLEKLDEAINSARELIT